MLTEQEIKNSILQWLSWQRECVAWVNDSVGIFDPTKKVFRKRKSKYARKGVSDIVACWRGFILCIEVKRPKTGKLTPEQVQFIQDITRIGGMAMVARSLDDVIDFLRAKGMLEERKTS